EQIPAFARAFDRLDPSGELRRALYAEPSIEAEKRLMATEVCQPVMAALGLALQALLEEMNVKADFTPGHSLGAFPAAPAAGGLRGEAMVALNLPDPGAMASAAADRETVAQALRGIDGAVVANLNHPRQTVISGTTEGVRQASQALSGRDVQMTPLDVSHAFH